MFNLVEDMLKRDWSRPEKKEEKPLLKSVPEKVAPKIDAFKPKGKDRISTTQSNEYIAIPPQYVDERDYRKFYNVALDQEPLKEISDVSSRIDALIKKREGSKEDAMPTALSAIARLFSEKGGVGEDVIGAVEGLAGRRRSDELGAIKEALAAEQERGSLAQTRGMLAAKGVDAQIVTPQLKESGSTVVREGDLYREPTGRDNRKEAAELTKRLKDLQAAREAANQFEQDVLSQKDIAGIGLSTEGALPDWALKIGGAFGNKNAEMGSRNRDQLIAVGNYMTKALSGTRATDKDFQRAVRTFSGETFQSESNLRKGLSDLKRMLDEDENLIRSGFDPEISSLVESRRDYFRSNNQNNGGLSDDKRKRLEELRAKKAAGTLGK